jgi:NAD(P)-dependent dehydrogenase (short-subunit alcohol dehydrogenase family)
MMTDRRVAIITGGGQGIGKCIARTFLENSISVAIMDIDQEAGRETQREFSKLGDIIYLPCDVGKQHRVVKAIDKVLDHFGRIDILVNNAAIGITKPLFELTLDEWNRVIGVNLTGAFLFSKYCAPCLLSTKGVILNISSTRAFMSEPHTEAYSASKGGLHTLTHALAISLGPDIRVNCISPGWIEVSQWKKHDTRTKPDLTKKDHQQHPAGRVGGPEDVASLALYLISPESDFITGANFVVDGGMTRKMVYV